MWNVKAITKAAPLILSLLMASAHAENWAAIGVAASNSQTVYVDMDSVEREGGFARFWLKAGIKKNVLSFNAYTDSIEHVVLNCEERTFAVTKSVGVRSNGERVSIKEVAPAAWSFTKVADTSTISNHWSQFCPAQVVSVQPPVAQVNTPSAATPPPAFSTGSGFFVTLDGYFVTNYHVIAGAEEIVLVDVNSKTHSATVVRIDKANDIAVLKADGKFKAIPVVSSRSAKRGQSVITVGYPHTNIQGLEPKVTSGIINSLTGLNNDARTFQISVPLQSGNSGGPLVTTEGNAIGVVAMKLSALAVFKATGDLPQNVNYAIKSNYLLEVLLNIPGLEQKLLPSSQSPYKSVADLTNAIEGATGLVIATVKEAETKPAIAPKSAQAVGPAKPNAQTVGDVLRALREGRYMGDGGYILAPDIAENGAVVPAEINLASPLADNECVYLFVDDAFLSHKACVRGSARLGNLSIRVKMPRTGNLRVAVVHDDGRIRSFAKSVSVTVGSTPETGSIGGRSLDARMLADRGGGYGHIKMLLNNPMTTDDHLQRVVFLFGGGNAIEVETTPWASRNPFVGISFLPPPGVTSFISEVTTNRGLSTSLRGTF